MHEPRALGVGQQVEYERHGLGVADLPERAGGAGGHLVVGIVERRAQLGGGLQRADLPERADGQAALGGRGVAHPGPQEGHGQAAEGQQDLGHLAGLGA